MFRMSFEPWYAENVEETVLVTPICMHASCMQARPSYICACTLYMRMHKCS